jgi:hypothetical protein
MATIENGQTADADEVRTILRILTGRLGMFERGKTTSSSSYDSRYFGTTNYNETSLNQSWAMTSTGMSNKGSNAGRGEDYYKDDNNIYTLTSYAVPLLSSSSKVMVIPQYNVFKLYDECDDSAVSGTNWIKLGTATATEDGNNIEFPANSIYRTSDLSAEKDIYLLCDVLAINVAGAVSIGFFDGANSVTLFTRQSDGAYSDRAYALSMHIKLDWTNKRAFVNYRFIGGLASNQSYVYSSENFYTEVFDISSLSTNLYIRFSVSNNAGNVLKVYHLRLGKASPSTTMTLSTSRDGGSNYTTFTTPFGLSSATGSSIICKATGTVASNEVLSFRGWNIYEEVT